VLVSSDAFCFASGLWELTDSANCFFANPEKVLRSGFIFSLFQRQKKDTTKKEAGKMNKSSHLKNCADLKKET
jgi:hypothetical protein